MARIIIFLLYLLSRSNAYADNQWWSCNWSWNTAYGWVCIQQYQPPPCINQVEYQTLGCPVHYTGSINQSRNYICSTGTWSAWTTTSNNCTQLPPTCQTSTQSQTLVCQAGYVGNIIQSKSSTCSDPYGTPVWSDWITTSNTCVMSNTNVNNPLSPVSPISPMNPNSPVSALKQNNAQPTQQESVIAPTPVTITDTTTTTTTSSTQATTSQVSTTPSNEPKTSQAVIPKGKEIVPGFGIVMSMQLLNQGYNMQQQQLTEYINLNQEQEYGRQQDFLIDLITANDIGNNFNSIANYRWRSLLGDNPLQRSGFGD